LDVALAFGLPSNYWAWQANFTFTLPKSQKFMTTEKNTRYQPFLDRCALPLGLLSIIQLMWLNLHVRIAYDRTPLKQISRTDTLEGSSRLQTNPPRPPRENTPQKAPCTRQKPFRLRQRAHFPRRRRRWRRRPAGGVHSPGVQQERPTGQGGYALLGNLASLSASHKLVERR
jgi:hypothetical protein